MHPSATMTAHRSNGRKRHRGFTLVEVMIASMMLLEAVLSLMVGITFGCKLAKRAHHETQCELRCLDRMEEVMMTPYDVLATNEPPDSGYNPMFPVEYSNTVLGAGNSVLEWTMTTIVTEVTYKPGFTPILYKKVQIEAGWNTYGGNNKYTTFMLLRAPVELKESY